jgi:CBS domain-containing protein
MNEVKRKLCDEHDFPVVFDFDHSVATDNGGNVLPNITRYVETHDILIILTSPQAVASDYVRHEVRTSIAKYPVESDVNRRRRYFLIPDEQVDIATIVPLLVARINELGNDPVVKSYKNNDGTFGIDKIAEQIKREFGHNVIDDGGALNEWWNIKALELRPSNAEVHCVTPDTTIADAGAELERIGKRHLLVTDTGGVGGKLVGIMSKGDIESAKPSAQSVQEIMTTYETGSFGQRLSTVTKACTVAKVLRRLVTPRRDDNNRQYYVTALPIIDSEEEGNVVGIVTYYDVLRAIVDPERRIPPPPQTVGDVMLKRDVINIAQSGESLANILLRHVQQLYNQYMIPVVADKHEYRLRGMITIDEVKRLIRHGQSSQTVDDIQVNLPELFLCHPTHTLEEMIKVFTERGSENNFKVHKLYAMITAEDTEVKDNSRSVKTLSGLISYVEVFKKLIDMIPEDKRK